MVVVGGSVGWKLSLLQSLLSQMQIDGRLGQKAKGYRWLPLPCNHSTETRGFSNKFLCQSEN